MIYTGADCPCGHPIVTDRHRQWCAVCGAQYGKDGHRIAPAHDLVVALDEALYGPKGVTS